MASPSTSSYREHAAPAALRGLVACGWRQEVGAEGHVQRVVPDGCVDLIWRAGRSLVVAGPATRPVLAQLPAGSTTVGVRFRPGAGAAFLGLPLSELRDDYVALEQLWSGVAGAGGGGARGRRRSGVAGVGGARALRGSGGARGDAAAARLADLLAGAASDDERLALLEDAVLTSHQADGPYPVDPLVTDAARRLAVPDATVPSVASLGDALGVSERQLLRRFRAAVGYGPKTLARVLRFQRFLTAVWGSAAASSAWSAAEARVGSAPPAGGFDARRTAVAPADRSLARLALDAGYADQAHLTRECRVLAGVPPSTLLRGT